MLLHVPEDGTDKLRVGVDREHGGLEQELGDVPRRKVDEVMPENTC